MSSNTSAKSNLILNFWYANSNMCSLCVMTAVDSYVAFVAFNCLHTQVTQVTTIIFNTLCEIRHTTTHSIFILIVRNPDEIGNICYHLR